MTVASGASASRQRHEQAADLAAAASDIQRLQEQLAGAEMARRHAEAAQRRAAEDADVCCRRDAARHDAQLEVLPTSCPRHHMLQIITNREAHHGPSSITTTLGVVTEILRSTVVGPATHAHLDPPQRVGSVAAGLTFGGAARDGRAAGARAAERAAQSAP